MSDTYPTWRCLTCQRNGTGDVPGRCPSCDAAPQALVVRITEQCTLRMPVDIPAESREALLRKMQEIRPAKPRRAHSYERARKLAANAATARLAERALPAGDPTGRWMVRIWYRSMGDEVLTFDAGPMSEPAARALASEHGHCAAGPSLALDAEAWQYLADAADHGAPASSVRHVVLPSQMADPVQEIATPDLPGMTIGMPSDGWEPDDSRETAAAESYAASLIPSEPRVWNTYHAEAMWRRARRFETMYRRSVSAA